MLPVNNYQSNQQKQQQSRRDNRNQEFPPTSTTNNTSSNQGGGGGLQNLSSLQQQQPVDSSTCYLSTTVLSSGSCTSTQRSPSSVPVAINRNYLHSSFASNSNINNNSNIKMGVQVQIPPSTPSTTKTAAAVVVAAQSTGTITATTPAAVTTGSSNSTPSPASGQPIPRRNLTGVFDEVSTTIIHQQHVITATPEMKKQTKAAPDLLTNKDNNSTSAADYIPSSDSSSLISPAGVMDLQQSSSPPTATPKKIHISNEQVVEVSSPSLQQPTETTAGGNVDVPVVSDSEENIAQGNDEEDDYDENSAKAGRMPTFILHDDLKGDLSQALVNRVSFYGVIHDINKEANAMADNDPSLHPSGGGGLSLGEDETGDIPPAGSIEKFSPLVMAAFGEAGAAAAAAAAVVTEEEQPTKTTTTLTGSSPSPETTTAESNETEEEEINTTTNAAAAATPPTATTTAAPCGEASTIAGCTDVATTTTAGRNNALIDEEKWLLSAIESRTYEDEPRSTIPNVCPPTFSQAMGEREYETSMTSSRTQLWKPSRSWWEAKSGKNPWIEPKSHNKRWRFLWPLIHYHKFLAKCIKKLKRNGVDVKTSVSPVSVFLREEVCAVSDHLAAVSLFSSEEWMACLEHFHGWADTDVRSEKRLRKAIWAQKLRSLAETADIDSPLLKREIDEAFLKAMAAQREQMKNGASIQQERKEAASKKKQQQDAANHLALHPSMNSKKPPLPQFISAAQSPAFGGRNSRRKSGQRRKSGHQLQDDMSGSQHSGSYSTMTFDGHVKHQQQQQQYGNQHHHDYNMYPTPPPDHHPYGYGVPPHYPPSASSSAASPARGGPHAPPPPPGDYYGYGGYHPGGYPPHMAPPYGMPGHYHHPANSAWGADPRAAASFMHHTHQHAVDRSYYHGGDVPQSPAYAPGPPPPSPHHLQNGGGVPPPPGYSPAAGQQHGSMAQSPDETPHKFSRHPDASGVPPSPYWGHLDSLAMAGLMTPHKPSPQPATPQRSRPSSEKILEEHEAESADNYLYGESALDAKPLLINHPSQYYNQYGAAGEGGYVPPSPASQFLMSPQAHSAAYYARNGPTTGGSPASGAHYHNKGPSRKSSLSRNAPQKEGTVPNRNSPNANDNREEDISSAAGTSCPDNMTPPPAVRKITLESTSLGNPAKDSTSDSSSTVGTTAESESITEVTAS